MSAGPALRHGILSTDAYQLTMAQLYLRAGLHERRVRFEHFFRSYPDYGDHQAGYCVAAGLGAVRRVGDVDAGDAGRRRRAARPPRRAAAAGCSTTTFCDWFAGVDFGGLRLDAVPEGRVVHPNTPITVVEGPLAAAQLLETPLLNQLNFATLIATKAARVVEAAARAGRCSSSACAGPPPTAPTRRRGRRSSAARRRRRTAAVGYELGLTPAGTHAHSMVQLFLALGEGEQAAFDAYADVYPDDTLLLVDTVDTLGSGDPQRHRHVRAAAPAPATSRSASASTPATSPTSPCRRPASSTGPASRTP